MRTFGLIITSLLILPALLGVDGVWLTSAASSTLTAVTAAVFLARFLYGQKKEGRTEPPSR